MIRPAMNTVVELREAFGLDHLTRIERPIADLQSGQIRLRMQAASLNYRDYLMVTGGYGNVDLPLVPCSDGVGEVIEIADDVTDVRLGDRVTPTFIQDWPSGPITVARGRRSLGGPLDGVLQTEMVVRADSVVAMPEYLSDAEAATLPCAAVTAWNALIAQGQLQPGETVAIQGTGGVALFALQFAKLAGARVAITSKSDDKLECCRALGADFTINYRTMPKWGAAVREWSSGGVDHVIELGGSETLKQSIRAIRPEGSISLIGVLSGAVAELVLPLVVLQNIRLQGVTVGSRQTHAAMVRAMAAHAVKPVVDRSFGFDTVPEALQYLKSGQHFGKVVLQIN
ncbi:MAG: NAD(P)-dependent alcohol dehydrogenase [Rhodothermales bacterium]